MIAELLKNIHARKLCLHGFVPALVREIASASKANSLEWNCRLTCRRRRFSGAYAGLQRIPDEVLVSARRLSKSQRPSRRITRSTMTRAFEAPRSCNRAAIRDGPWA